MANMSTAGNLTRTPTSLQGVVLISTAWLAVMGAAVISPILPRIGAEFHTTSNAPLLVSLIATFPALFIALMAAPIGLLADRIGQKRVLLSGVLCYGFLGIAPHWLHSLQAIVLSRAGVGITEAAIITCGTALLGDYFAGGERERWFALQTGSSNVIAVIAVALGGVLGEGGWRKTFFIYGFSFVLLPLVSAFIWEPARQASRSPVVADVLVVEATPFRWGKLLSICLVTTFASIAFYVIVVQLSFLLTERGIRSPKQIGLGAALATLAMPVGAILFRLIRASYQAKLVLSFTLSAVGFFIVSAARGYAPTIAGAAVTGVGSGLALPTLISWALAGVPARLRGSGTGTWQAFFYFGQFLSPLLVLALAHGFGGLSNAVKLFAYACTLSALVFAVLAARTQMHPSAYQGPQ